MVRIRRASMISLQVLLFFGKCTLCIAAGAACDRKVQIVYPSPCEVYSRTRELKGWRIRKVRIKGLAGFFEVDDLLSSDPSRSLIHVKDGTCEALDESRFLDYLKQNNFDVTHDNVEPLTKLYLECYAYLSVKDVELEFENNPCFILRVTFVRSPPYTEQGLVVICGQGQALQFHRFSCNCGAEEMRMLGLEDHARSESCGPQQINPGGSGGSTTARGDDSPGGKGSG